MSINKLLKLNFVFLSILFFFISCASREKMVYFNEGVTEKNAILNYEEMLITLQPQDRITISVAAPEQDAAIPFNLPVVGIVSTNINGSLNNAQTLQNYTVNSEGNIDFPILGTIHVSGLTIEKLKSNLTRKISDFVKNPIVNIEITNYRISVVGEVNNPGTYLVNDQTISLPKALGFAGDMTIYGKRNNVLVIRQEPYGEITRNYLDLTDPETINSSYYFLKQNDVVYVEPNNAQIQGSKFNRNSGIFVSIASLMISLVVLLIQ